MGGTAPVTVIISNLNEKGFTLLEVLVSITILLFGLLGLLQALIVATESNAKNLIRDDVVFVADSCMNGLKARSFDNITTTYPEQTFKSNVRGQNLDYKVNMTSEWLGSNSRLLTVHIDWRFKNQNYSNQITSLRSR